jgi:UPF0755 protein
MVFMTFVAGFLNRMTKQKIYKNSIVKKAVIIALMAILPLLAIKGYFIYRKINAPNVNLNGLESDFIYIPTGANYLDVTNILYAKGVIINRTSFEWLAEQKGYPNNIKAGKYKLKANMSNNQLINKLQSGRQEPVNLVFNKIRTKERFAGIIARQIEADSVTLLKLLYNNVYLKQFNVNSETAMSLFVPNTYQFYWNTSSEQFFERMFTEYQRFWKGKRSEVLVETGLTQAEVVVMASIVEEETNKDDEKATIAGVYINRLRIGMRLQADPTVRYAIGDFGVKRILKKHLEVDSPYNTYKYAGLPPGPICLPNISSIDAVLNYEHHNYLYFCAKSDFSGYHAFAATLNEHNKNAEAYRKALNRNRIFK